GLLGLVDDEERARRQDAENDQEDADDGKETVAHGRRPGEATGGTGGGPGVAPVAVPAAGAWVGGVVPSRLGSGRYGKTPLCPCVALSMMILLLFFRISSIVSR